MPRILYAYIPITSFNDPEQVSESLETIKEKVRELTHKFANINDGFVVVEIQEVGRYEAVAPIWTEPTNDKTSRIADQQSPSRQGDRP